MQVECGPFHTVAVTKLGDVYTWGFGGNGRLGLAEQGQLNTEQRLTPELVRTLQGAAMKDDADVGMPVDDSQAATKALVKALRPKQISLLCLGGFHSAALSDQGDVYAWGEGRYGATGVDLSRDMDKEVRKPMRVLGLGGARNNVLVLAAGVKHMLAVTEDGKMYSWGDGSMGRLGHGDQTTVSEPRLLSTLKSQRMKACAAGEEHSLAAAADGTLFSWGSGSFGKLGHGEPVDESTPRPLASIKHQAAAPPKPHPAPAPPPGRAPPPRPSGLPRRSSLLSRAATRTRPRCATRTRCCCGAPAGRESSARRTTSIGWCRRRCPRSSASTCR